MTNESATDAPLILAMRPKQAAAAIGVSEKTLKRLRDKGEIRAAQIGTVAVYTVDELREFLRRRVAESTAAAAPSA